MEFLDSIKRRIPDFAKDIRLNLDSVIARSSLPINEAVGVALAAAFAARSTDLVEAMRSSGTLSSEEEQAALTAAALMGMNNTWYPYVEMTDDSTMRAVPAQLRMNAYATHGGVDKRKFEMYALAASIIGKCHFCVASHYAVLKEQGLDQTQLRDIGRIASVVAATGLVLATAAIPLATE